MPISSCQLLPEAHASPRHELPAAQSRYAITIPSCQLLPKARAPTCQEQPAAQSGYPIAIPSCQLLSAISSVSLSPHRHREMTPSLAGPQRAYASPTPARAHRSVSSRGVSSPDRGAIEFHLAESLELHQAESPVALIDQPSSWGSIRPSRAPEPHRNEPIDVSTASRTWRVRARRSISLLIVEIARSPQFSST